MNLFAQCEVSIDLPCSPRGHSRTIPSQIEKSERIAGSDEKRLRIAARADNLAASEVWRAFPANHINSVNVRPTTGIRLIPSDFLYVAGLITFSSLFTVKQMEPGTGGQNIINNTGFK